MLSLTPKGDLTMLNHEEEIEICEECGKIAEHDLYITLHEAAVPTPACLSCFNEHEDEQNAESEYNMAEPSDWELEDMRENPEDWGLEDADLLDDDE
jgi:hypothetical protein